VGKTLRLLHEGQADLEEMKRLSRNISLAVENVHSFTLAFAPKWKRNQRAAYSVLSVSPAPLTSKVPRIENDLP
jgi:hypothetical protein